MLHLNVLPKISEKALEGTTDKVYVFFVPNNSNKTQVKSAIEKQFEVEVKHVKMVNVKGKVKKSMRKRLQPIDGKRANRKKAYVTLSKGEIKILEEVA